MPMTPAFRIATLTAALLLSGSCSPHGSSQGATDPRIRDALLRELGARSGVLYDQSQVDIEKLRFDSSVSKAVPNLHYYWAEYRPSHHQFTFVTAVERDGRWDLVGKEGAWQRVVGDWTPQTERDALAACFERIAVEGNSDPNRLLFAEPWNPDSLSHRYFPENRRQIQGVLRTPASVELGVQGDWRVITWYLDAGRAANPARLAAKYICESKSGPRSASTLFVVDSVIGLGRRR